MADRRISAFQGPGRILWVCATEAQAKRRWHDLGEPQHVVMRAPGGSVGGQAFIEIIIDDLQTSQMESDIVYERTHEWLRDLRCRLLPGGKWRELSRG